MNLLLSRAEGRRVATRRRRAAASRLRPGLEGLEDRTVMSTAAPGVLHSGHLTLPLPPAVVAPAVTQVHATPQVHAAAVAVHKAVKAKPAATTPAPTQVLQLNLPPIDLNLLGLEVKTSRIVVTVSAQSGSGELLGNLLTDVSNLLNLKSVNGALNNVLGNVVGLLNKSTLAVTGVNTGGSLGSTVSKATVPVLNLYVAPVHLNLLGALVDTSAIQVTITAHTGPGLILGDVVGDLAHLFDPPLPSKLSLDYIDGKLGTLLTELNQQIPGFGTAAVKAAATTAASNTRNILALTVPPIDLNLLGLILKTSQIQVNADAISGSGNLLGNVLTDLLNTVGATPQNIGTLNGDVNAILAKLIGVLNAATLTLPANATSTLSQALQTLALPNLVSSSTTATAPILNLIIASPSGSTAAPVNVNLLGLKITTSNIQAQLLAQTGQGKILGNLLFNVSHLLDPGGSTSLLSLLNVLGL